MSCFAVSVWSLFYVLMMKESDHEKAVLYAKITNITAAYMGVFVAHFCKEITAYKPNKFKLITFGYASSCLFTIFGFTKYFCTVSPFLNFKNYVYPLQAYHFFTLHFFFFMFYAIYILSRSLPGLDEPKRNQIRYIIIALSCGYLGGISTFLPVYRVPVEPFFSLFVWLYAAIISFAIVKHQLMDIRVVIKRTIYYSIFAFMLSLFYVTVVFFAHGLIKGDFRLSSDPGIFSITWLSFLALATTLSCYFIGAFVFLKQPKSSVNRWYAASLLCMGLWTTDKFIYILSAHALVAHRWLYIGPILSQICYLNLALSVTRRLSKPSKFLCNFIMSACAAYLIYSTIGGFLLGPMNPSHYLVAYFTPTENYHLFVAYTFICGIIGSIVLINGYLKEVSALQRMRIIYILFAAVLMYIAGTLYFLFVYDFKIFFAWVLISELASVLLVAYAILKHQLMDIRIVIKKTLFYSCSVFLISALYVLAIFFFHGYFTNRKVSSNYLFGSAALILFITLLLRPIEMFLRRVLDKKFFKGTIDEISEQKEKLQIELERRERLKSVGILAAGMAHEIKNPLTAIQTFAEYLPEKYDDPEFREKFSRIIRQEVARVKEIVSDLLVFSKPSEPKMRLFEVGKLIEGLVGLISNDAMKAGVTIERESEPVSVFADPDQMKQAFLNILMNAIDAMRPKGGLLSIRTKVMGGSAEISVRDTGRGISKTELAHIFDPFYTNKDDGTGLGLAITHSIIEKNEGKVRVSSEVGEGTEFVVVLPIKEARR